VKIGYILRKFPVLSETFILNEILALEKRGVQIHIFALAPSRDPRFHDGVVRLRAAITYVPGILDLRNLLPYAKAAAQRYGPAYRRTLSEVLLSGQPRLFWRFLQAAYIAERARRLQLGHLHAHFANRSTTVARLASKMSAIPYTFTAHAFDIYKQTVNPAVLRQKIDDASSVITISHSNEDYLKMVVDGSTDKIRMLHNGIDVSAFSPDSIPEHQPFRILCVARLVEKKGLTYLVEACRILKDRGLAFRCRIVGRGALRSQLNDLIRELQLEDCVKLLGPRRQSEVPQLYREASVYVLPSVVAHDGNREGLPVSIVENGLLVPERDALSLAEALTRLMQDRELYARLRDAARPTVVPSFDIESTSGVLQQLLVEVGR
jgi:glycosyltransferase involved in cell wall biosynthesis